MGFRHCPREVFYQAKTYKVCDESGEDPTC